MTASSIRVAIADDQELIRSAVAAMVRSQPDLELVVQATDGVHLLAQLRAHRVDVVLMDIRMPRLDGIEATRMLRLEHPAVRVLVLTTFDLDEYVFAALRAGASGFLLKDTSAEAIARAIRAVHAGDAVLAPRVTATVVDFVARASPSDPEAELDQFTSRERDVLRLLITGANNDDIGRALFMTGNTVKTHIKAILGKLGMPDRVHVVIWAYENGVVESV
jgi:DNA-binding NarL/FixJ family response regulator